MTDDQVDDNLLDHDDDILGGDEPLTGADGDLFVLFAEALDPDSPKTIDEAKAEWEELLDAGS